MLGTPMAFRDLQHFALPILTTLIGSGGFIIGYWTFIHPRAAAQAFGGYMVRMLEESSDISSPTSTKTGDADSLAHILPHGIRNFVQGATILALTAFWQRSTPPARLTIQRCLGIVITTGVLTPIVDAYVNFKTAPAGEAGDADRKIAWVHATRTGIWMVGGVWCLIGRAQWSQMR
jgi:hypothetical protein